MFNSAFLFRYFENHKDLPHVSKYHRENYFEHSLLVIDEMAKRTDNPVLLIAACLHDVAKPRTQALNKVNEPCFYGHDEITDEEMQQFLSADDERYSAVKALVVCHMVPYICSRAKDFDKSVRKGCRKALKKAGFGDEVSDDFIHEVMLLHEADDAGSIRRDEDLNGIQERMERAVAIIKGLQ